MNFKAFTGGGGSGGDSSTSFAAAKALFEAAKKPENRAFAAAAAKNPVVRNAAISAAQNPQTRQAMVSAASTYGAHQSSPAPPVLRPEPAPKPPSKDYGSSAYGSSSSTSYGGSSSYGAAPKPPAAAVKPVYPDLMSELKALNIGRDNEPAPSYHSTPVPAPVPWNTAPAYQPPAPKPPPVEHRQDWTKFSDAPARPPPPRGIPMSPKSTSPTTEAYAVVKYPHNGSHFDELTCVAGDRIVLKREVDEQWIYGLNQRTGKFGIVPIAFVDVRVPLVPSPSVQKSGGFSPAPPMHSPSHAAHMATALYDYFSQEPGDLTFSQGATVKILERVGTEWLSGEINGCRGIFPSNFVDCPTLASVPLQQVQQRPAAAAEQLQATYDYNSGVAGDLTFYSGEVIEVVQRLPDGEWIKGRVRGAEGLAPLTYLTTMTSSMSHSSSSNHSLAAAANSRFPPGTPCEPPITVTAIADHHTTENDCLYFSAGDQILITEYVDNEWAKGKLAEFKKLPAGYFQRNYVQ